MSYYQPLSSIEDFFYSLYLQKYNFPSFKVLFQLNSFPLQEKPIRERAYFLRLQKFSEVINMNKRKILEMVEKDFLTIANLERSLKFALNSQKGRQYQYKVLHASFKRTCDIILNRRKFIAIDLSLKLQVVRIP